MHFVSDTSGEQEFLLPLDLREWPGDDLQLASARVLEAVRQVTAEPEWGERFALPISSRVSVVIRPSN